MEIPEYTEVEIEEKRQLVEERFPQNLFNSCVAENLVIIEKCFGQRALQSSLLQLEWDYKNGKKDYSVHDEEHQRIMSMFD